MDLTMFSTAEVTNVNHFNISCLHGERSLQLGIERDGKILQLPKHSKFKVHKSKNKEVVAKDFGDLEHIGVFYCKPTQEDSPKEKVTMINNCVTGGFSLLLPASSRFLNYTYYIHLYIYIYLLYNNMLFDDCCS